MSASQSTEPEREGLSRCEECASLVCGVQACRGGVLLGNNCCACRLRAAHLLACGTWLWHLAALYSASPRCDDPPSTPDQNGMSTQRRTLLNKFFIDIFLPSPSR